MILRKIQLHPKTITLELLKRAEFKCEYCKQPISIENSYNFECDHIYPKSKKGSENIDNKAISCSKCNRLKSNKIDALNPYDNKRYPFFNPRQEQWDKHFEISTLSGVIIVKTSLVEATVFELQLDTKEIKTEHLINDQSVLEQENKETLNDLSLLRKYRLSTNEYFDHVQSFGEILLSREDILLSKNKYKLQFIIATQIIESYFTRSRSKSEVITGINKVNMYIKYFQKCGKQHLSNRLSLHLYTLYRQLNFFRTPTRFLLPNSVIKQIYLMPDNSLVEELKKVKKSIFIDKRFSYSRIRSLTARLHELDEIYFKNKTDYIFALLDILDIYQEFPEYFNKISFEYIVKSAIIANNIVVKHYQNDPTLISLIQRRIIALNLSSDQPKNVLQKKELLAFAKSNLLFNEIRQISLL